jgi:hypothetical protein
MNNKFNLHILQYTGTIFLQFGEPLELEVTYQTHTIALGAAVSDPFTSSAHPA